MEMVPAPAWIPHAEADQWRTDLGAWLEGVLAEHGQRMTDLPTVHKLAPWSIVVTVPIADGRVWFKQNVPSLGPEPELLRLLSRLVPGRVPAPLGVEPSRGWLLLPDQGTTLRARASDDDPAVWAGLLSEWSLLTRAVAGHAADLAAIGVPRLAPADAAGYLGARIEHLASLPTGNPAQLTAADAARLTAVLPRLARDGHQLAALGLPDTLWHNDLHTNNVFDTAAGLVFFDLGDALLGSPLADLLIPLRFLAHAQGTAFDPGDDPFADPGLARAVEAALEPWTDLAPARDLRDAVPAALRLGVLGRSESWRRALAGAGREIGPDFADASTSWLLELVGGAKEASH